jgi:hypothetical protein
MICVLMLAIAALGWGFAASDYAVAEEDFRLGDGVGASPGLSYRRARGAFIRNAIEQIPKAPAVISHTWSKARWIFYVFGGLEIGAVILAVVAMRVEKGLAEMGQKRKGKRRT